MKKAELSGQIYLLLTILIWSATPAVAKIALGELDNYQLMLYTSLAGVLSLFIVIIFQGKLGLLRKYSNRDLLIMTGMGFLGVFLYYIILYEAFARAPAGQANVINYLWPIFMVIFSIPILREKASYKTLVAIILSFFGAALTFTQGNINVFNSEYSSGYGLAALAAILYGLFSVLGKKLPYEKYSSIFIYQLAALLFTIPSTLLLSEFVVPHTLATIISILILGGIMNSIVFVFWFKALALGNTHQTANFIYGVPFLAMIWTYFLNNEPISFVSLIGLSLIVTGVLIQAINRS